MFVITFTAAVIVLVVTCTGQETCGPNQVFSECSTACPNYCHKDNKLQICTLQCIIGCACAPGYVKKYVDSSQCVSMKECFRAIKCGHNKTYYTCGSACPRYCGQPDNAACPAVCVRGCQCKPGYVLIRQDSTHCIPASLCRS